ncbi:DUF4233 domain-containing protein [Mycetocola reblochoni]|uniref:DUF4233 domain-containing protein n=1 Tax=Mycetocola reblochoni TaxID=331618 RepID=A0A3L6ZQ06_9MICO|nr:DUF4233 domain-containing protein [Mycetocola reblochoni]RLP69927.1 DUF4233 domain-containing protein [Mycetocola reblochoni]
MRGRSITQMLGAVVVTFELLVIFLGSLVAFGLKAVPPATAFIGGGAICLALIVSAVLLPRRVGVVVGTVVHVAIVVTGVLLPAMYVVGGLFLALWVYCMYTGTTIDRGRLAAGTESAP